MKGMNLQLLEFYDKEKHDLVIKKQIKKEQDFIMIPLFSQKWKTDNKIIPYYITTYLLDAYYHIPERPDISFLFFWECINNLYNDLQFPIERNDPYSDSNGIILLSEELNSEIEKEYIINGKTYNLESMFSKLIIKCPLKAYNFISSYILKGYAIEQKIDNPKIKDLNPTYSSFKKKCPFYNIIVESYGKAYCNICSPVRDGDLINLNISDKTRSIQIIQSLSKKLKELIENGTTKITFLDNHSENITMTKDKRIPFLLRHLLYAVRCNNFHGNVASRLNSIYANEDSYEVSKFLCILSYFFINISLIHEKKMNEYDFVCSLKLLDLNYNIKTE